MDPERPIEKLLRETAKKRRDQAGAPFELHPATRRLLQGEVARLFKSRAPEGRLGWRSIFLSGPRLAWGLAGIAVLLLAAVLVLLPYTHNKQQQFLANNETPLAPLPPPSTIAADSEKLKAESRTQLADTSLADQQALAANRSEELPARDFSKDLPKAMTLSEPRPTFDLGVNRSDSAALTNGTALGGLFTANGAAQPALAPAESSSVLRSRESATALAMAPAVSPAAAPPLESDLKRRFAAPVSEMGGQANKPASPVLDAYFTDFMRATNFGLAQLAAPAAANSVAASAQGFRAVNPVLVSFKVEQAGDEFRIVDRDGSVYTGFLQNAGGESVVRGMPSTDGRTTASHSLSLKTASQSQAFVDNLATGRYFFRVSGTNKSLNQKVVFSGNLVPALGSGTPGSSTNVMSWPAGNVTSSHAQPTQGWLLNSRVSGRALINDRQQIEINAVPGKP